MATPPDPFAELGLPPDASLGHIQAARRRLAKQAHPDAGGSSEEMQRVNDAAARAIRALAARTSTAGHGGPRPDPAPRPGAPRYREYRGGARRDHPSFTIETAPAEAYQGLATVATWLGQIIHTDPPHVLEVAMTEPVRGWCRLDVAPEAEASTVSLAVAPEPGYPYPDLDRVRDAWVAALNRLDWTSLDQRPLRP